MQFNSHKKLSLKLTVHERRRLEQAASDLLMIGRILPMLTIASDASHAIGLTLAALDADSLFSDSEKDLQLQLSETDASTIGDATSTLPSLDVEVF